MTPSGRREKLVTAAVLVGGKGTRLGALTQATPKPLMPICADRLFLDYLLENLSRHGLDTIHLVAGYLGEQVYDRYHDQGIHGCRIKVTIEPEAAGTAGALTYVKDELPDAFFVLNGDSLFDFNFLSLVPHLDDGTDAVLALRNVENSGRYGSVDMDEGRILQFREKDPEQIGPGLISGGVYYLRRAVLDRIAQLPASIETEIFPAIAKSGRLAGLARSGYFIDIGLPESLAVAQRDLPNVTRRSAAFFDRDGTLTVDHGYTHKPSDLVFQPGAIDAIRACNEAGRLVVLVTNQAGIGRGYYAASDMDAFHAAMQDQLRQAGAHIDAFYACPYHADAKLPALKRDQHPDRKPMAGMLYRAKNELDIEQAGSFIVGDMPTDLAAGEAFGIPGSVIEPGELLSATQNLLTQSIESERSLQMDMIDDIKAWNDKMKAWLMEDAFPLWAGTGFDQNALCFTECISQAGDAVEMQRRIRVQARQTFAFTIAMELGWDGPAETRVRAGIDVLLSKGINQDGGTTHKLSHSGEVCDDRRDLYDVAFVIFALAAAARVLDDSKIAAHALELADWTFETWGAPEGGLLEGEIDSIPPRRQNPHMHMLEALLQLSRVNDAPRILERADHIVDLFERRFSVGQHGSLLEYFAQDWTPMDGDQGRITEPGHQLEWFWLLHQYAKRRGQAVSQSANALYLHAETYGVDRATGFLVNEVWDDGSVRSGRSRLWPHTERIKGNLARFESTGQIQVLQNCRQALESLWTYFQVSVRGSWYDMRQEDGSYIDQAAPASSFYHITLALSELDRVLKRL